MTTEQASVAEILRPLAERRVRCRNIRTNLETPVGELTRIHCQVHGEPYPSCGPYDGTPDGEYPDPRFEALRCMRIRIGPDDVIPATLHGWHDDVEGIRAVDASLEAVIAAAQACGWPVTYWVSIAIRDAIMGVVDESATEAAARALVATVEEQDG